MTRRLLVVNGDDFGLTPGVNEGIVDAHRRGVLTSASLFACAPATPHAIELTRALPALGVGCHLAVVDGEPALPPDSIPTLVCPDGRFRPTWRAFVVDCLRGRVSLDEAERELTAQVERLRAAGVRLTHLDSHKHVHAYPPLFDVVARLAGRFGVPAVRVPVERPALRLFVRNAGRGAGGRQAAENVALAYWGALDRRRLQRPGRQTHAPWFLGRIHTGIMTPDALRSIVRRVRPGMNELMLHPGYPDAALDRVHTRLREARARETALACATETRSLLARADIALVNHRGEPHPGMEQT